MKKLIHKLIFSMLVILGLSVVSFAQSDGPKKPPPKPKPPVIKPKPKPKPSNSGVTSVVILDSLYRQES